MKKIIAKFLQWCLRKLGYNEVYAKDNQVHMVITCDASEVFNQIEKMKREIKRFKA